MLKVPPNTVEAQRFLTTWARKDKWNAEHITVKRVAVPVTLTKEELMLYKSKENDEGKDSVALLQMSLVMKPAERARQIQSRSVGGRRRRREPVPPKPLCL